MANTLVKIETTDNKVIYTATPEGTEEKVKEIYENAPKFKAIKFFKGCEVPYEELPENVKKEVKETLGAYREVNVTFEHFAFHVAAGCGIKSNYYFDHTFCNTYKDTEIYTPEELREVHIKKFGYTC